MQPTNRREYSRKLIPPTCVLWYLCTFKTPASSSPPEPAQDKSHHLPLLDSHQSLPMTVLPSPPGDTRQDLRVLHSVESGPVAAHSLIRQNKRV